MHRSNKPGDRKRPGWRWGTPELRLSAGGGRPNQWRGRTWGSLSAWTALQSLRLLLHLCGSGESGSHPGFLGLGLRDHPENSSGLLGLFVLLGKFPSTSESWLRPLAGNIWWSLAGGREAWGQGSGVCGVGVGRVWSPGTKKAGWGLVFPSSCLIGQPCRAFIVGTPTMALPHPISSPPASAPNNLLFGTRSCMAAAVFLLLETKSKLRSLTFSTPMPPAALLPSPLLQP